MIVRARLLCAVLAAGVCGVAAAQVPADPTGGATEGITVFGAAQVNARPNLVEIDLRASGTAELTDDALVKFSDAKKRTLEAFDALKLKSLKIVERGVSLGPGNMQEMMQAMWQGMPMNAAKKTKIEISSTLHLELADIKEMPTEEVLKTIGKLLDTAQDSGTAFGPSAAEMQNAYRYGRQPSTTIVKFVLKDLDTIREQVYEGAVADARARAGRLAKLSGVKLGPVISVQEIQVSGDETPQRVVQPWETVSAEPEARLQPRIESSTLAEIPFRVKLMVRFAIERDATKTASSK
jgi:uncharacterized protein YggE